MGWLLLIGALVVVAVAARSRQGTRVLARIWVVLSLCWVPLALWDLALIPGAPPLGWTPSPTSILAEVALPPLDILAVFVVIRWIIQGAKRRPGD